MTLEPKCGRCRKPSTITTGSFFDTSMICIDCDERERSHPQFERAHDADVAAMRRGDFNFPGIGVPVDLLKRG